METLYLCEVELKSLADFEKFGDIITHEIECANVRKIDVDKGIRSMKTLGSTYVTLVVNENDLAELKKWFRVARAIKAVCVNSMLYTIY